MVRRLLVSVLLLSVTACDAEWGGDDTKVSVRLRTDGGTSAGLNQVIVTSASGAQIGGRTGGDGKANIRVPGSGEYTVRVTPRNGFHWSEALTKRVTVTPGGTAIVEFVLYRTAGGLPPERLGQ